MWNAISFISLEKGSLMKKFTTLQVVALFIILAFTIQSYAADNWPTWRGPDCMGISENGKPPTTWSETENIKWKVKLNGDGSDSSPVIWQDKIFFQSAVKIDKEVKAPASAENQGGGRRRFGGSKPTNEYKFNLVCLDRKTGKTIWEKTVIQQLPHEGHHGDHGFTSYSPVTDGKNIWASFGSRGVYCFDMDGNIKWSKDIGKLNTRNSFGEGSSPTLAGNALIVLMDHEGDSFIVAFDKKTGDQLWKKDRDEPTSWSTPITATVNGKLQVIVNGTNRVRAYDAATGDIVWQCAGQTTNAIPTPVLGKDLVYCTSGFRGSALYAIKLGATGELTDTDSVIWQKDDATPYVPSPLLYQGRLYVSTVNNGIVACYNAADGKPFYTKEALDEIKGVYASPIGAADRVYYVGRNGVTYVLKASDKFEVISVNKLNDGIDASPAVIGNEIYLKGKQYLYCIAETK